MSDWLAGGASWSRAFTDTPLTRPRRAPTFAEKGCAPVLDGRTATNWRRHVPGAGGATFCQDRSARHIPGPQPEDHMPLYMDVHNHVDDLTREAVEGAHQRDLEVQRDHDVEYLRYWYNEEEGRVFCLVRAPSKEAAERVHREAHGLVADDIIEVEEGS